MIIVLKPNTTEKNITRVENLVKNRGLDTHLVRGTEMTIIGCIGDTTLIDPRLFEVDESVDKVMHVQEPYKLANRALSLIHPYLMTSPIPSLMKCRGSVFSTSGSIMTAFG